MAADVSEGRKFEDLPRNLPPLLSEPALLQPTPSTPTVRMSAVVDSQAPEEGLPVADARDKSATPSVERGSGVDSAEAEATPSREAGSEFSEAEYSYFVTSLKDEDNTERTKERTEKRFQRRSRLVSDAYAEISFSYFLLDHPARKLCMRIAGSTRFDEVVLLVVLVNCTCMILQVEDFADETPLSACRKSLSSANCGYYYAEVLFLAVYTVEAIIKIIASGFRGAQKAYLSEYWNVLDFSVLTMSLLTLGLELIYDKGGSNLSDLQSILVVFRLFRILRALRTVQKVQGLRMLVASLLRAVPLLLRVISMFALILILFACFGSRLFKGRLKSICIPNALLPDGYENMLQSDLEHYVRETTSGSTLTALRHCGGSCDEYHRCLSVKNPYHGYLNFDNFLFSIIAIFACITGEGWSDVMYRVSDSTKEVAMLYFLLIGIIGTNLMMNLLLAVIKESLSRVMTQMIKINKDKKLLALRKATIQAAMYGTPAEPRNSSFLTTALSISVSLLHAAKHYSEAALNRTSRVISDLAPAKEVEAAPPVDDTINVRLMGAISEACRRITDSKLFNVFTMTLVFVNTIMLSAVYSGMSAETYYILELTAAVFNIFFLLESIMKIIGNSWAVFITNYFDVFDFVVVLAGIMELTLSVSQLQGSGVKVTALRAVRVFRLMRVTRVLKVARYVDAIKAAGSVLKSSLNMFMYFTGLLLIFVFIFGVIGMQLFSTFYKDQRELEDSLLLAPRSNYRSFFWSILSVFQALTLEGWTIMMYDAMSYSRVAGSLFYISWIIIGPYILLALLVCGVLDNFEREYIEQRKRMQLSKNEKKKQDDAEEDHRRVSEMATPPQMGTPPQTDSTWQADFLPGTLTRGSEEGPSAAENGVKNAPEESESAVRGTRGEPGGENDRQGFPENGEENQVGAAESGVKTPGVPPSPVPPSPGHIGPHYRWAMKGKDIAALLDGLEVQYTQEELEAVHACFRIQDAEKDRVSLETFVEHVLDAFYQRANQNFPVH
ncbi:hypothetical protein CYMTET_20728, partial [Cymbomonas tetramitiformis]